MYTDTDHLFLDAVEEGGGEGEEEVEAAASHPRRQRDRVLRGIRASAAGLSRLLPSRLISRVVGKMHGIPVPRRARSALYKSWAYAMGADLSEVKDPLTTYRSLQDFFSRSLKDGVHVIDGDPNTLLSPCDGRVTSTSAESTTRAGGLMIAQVKGIEYPVASLLGLDKPPPLTNAGNVLHAIVMYLAPGDYHQFHSPLEWEVTARHHIPGRLLPVNKLAVNMLPSLYAANERVALFGKWKHGFFSFTAVGATNVGSIELDFDKTLKTNKSEWRALRAGVAAGRTIGRTIGKGVGVGLTALASPFRMLSHRRRHPPAAMPVAAAPVAVEAPGTPVGDGAESPRATGRGHFVAYDTPVDLHRGELMGRFRLGSTIVLVFEAPPDFMLTCTAGDRVRVGRPIGVTLNMAGEDADGVGAGAGDAATPARHSPAPPRPRSTSQFGAASLFPPAAPARSSDLRSRSMGDLGALGLPVEVPAQWSPILSSRQLHHSDSDTDSV